MSQQFKETETKRTYFVPALLLIILLSVIGNVVLYSKMITYKQEERSARGISIIESGMAAKEHFRAVIANVRLLLEDESMPARISAKSKLAFAYGAAGDVERFVAEAEQNNAEPFKYAHRDTAAFLAEAGQTLTQLGAHEGKLTSEERQYLQMIEEIYVKLEEAVKAFDYDESTMTSSIALTVQAGGKWVEMAGKLVEAMNEPKQLKVQF
ncbi:hypothetical protein [Paenibacillus sp. GCM10027626]|uniref:hypothetical protein n=1 Tax=Paenibacillus sp. GCM10027626 TaxID=3273411 RepID=UPI0036268971